MESPEQDPVRDPVQNPDRDPDQGLDQGQALNHEEVQKGATAGGLGAGPDNDASWQAAQSC